MKGTHASPEYDQRSRAYRDEAAAPRLARPVHRARADAIGICPPISHDARTRAIRARRPLATLSFKKPAAHADKRRGSGTNSRPTAVHRVLPRNPTQPRECALRRRISVDDRSWQTAFADYTNR